MTTMTQRVAGAWAAQAATTNARTTYAQWADTEPLWAAVDLEHLPTAMLRMPYVQACALFRFLLVRHRAGDQFATLTAVHLLRAGLTTQLSVFGRVMYRLEAGAVDSAVYLAAVEAIDSAAARDRETARPSRSGRCSTTSATASAARLPGSSPEPNGRWSQTLSGWTGQSPNPSPNRPSSRYSPQRWPARSSRPPTRSCCSSAATAGGTRRSSARAPA